VITPRRIPCPPILVGLLVLAITSVPLAPLANAADSDPRAAGPDVTIVRGDDRIVYEYRQSGQLRIIKVVPKVGRPYFLVPSDETRGFGDLERADMLIPRWVLLEF
jgi:hypothetical protein